MSLSPEERIFDDRQETAGEIPHETAMERGAKANETEIRNKRREELLKRKAALLKRQAEIDARRAEIEIEKKKAGEKPAESEPEPKPETKPEPEPTPESNPETTEEAPTNAPESDPNYPNMPPELPKHLKSDRRIKRTILGAIAAVLLVTGVGNSLKNNADQVSDEPERPPVVDTTEAPRADPQYEFTGEDESTKPEFTGEDESTKPEFTGEDESTKPEFLRNGYVNTEQGKVERFIYKGGYHAEYDPYSTKFEHQDDENYEGDDSYSFRVEGDTVAEQTSNWMMDVMLSPEAITRLGVQMGVLKLDSSEAENKYANDLRELSKENPDAYDKTVNFIADEFYKRLENGSIKESHYWTLENYMSDRYQGNHDDSEVHGRLGQDDDYGEDADLLLTFVDANGHNIISDYQGYYNTAKDANALGLTIGTRAWVDMKDGQWKWKYYEAKKETPPEDSKEPEDPETPPEDPETPPEDPETPPEEPPEEPEPRISGGDPNPEPDSEPDSEPTLEDTAKDYEDLERIDYTIGENIGEDIHTDNVATGYTEDVTKVEEKTEMPGPEEYPTPIKTEDGEETVLPVITAPEDYFPENEPSKDAEPTYEDTHKELEEDGNDYTKDLGGANAGNAEENPVLPDDEAQDLRDHEIDTPVHSGEDLEDLLKQWGIK